MERLEIYRRLVTKYLEDAESLLEKGDAVQTGEKLWGSVAEAVKAIAARRGRSLRTDTELWSFILDLDRQKPEEEFASLFALADHLHSNFYEDELPPAAVTRFLPKLKVLIAKLEAL